MLGLLTTDAVQECITLMPTEILPFGIAVKRGTVEGSCSKIAVDGTTEVPVGVTVIRHNEDGQYAIAEEAKILTKGSIVVEVLSTDTVAGGNKAYMIVASTNYGKFTKTAGSNTVEVGVFQSAKSGNLAPVKIDIVA
jgi:hypothetical protein